jgi:transcriptional regulator with XRE-family HTH domain
MKLNERLKHLRMQQNLTQEQVAEHLCVSAQSVSKWERGLVQPDLQMLPRLAILYHTSTDALLGMNEVWENSDRSRFYARLKEAYYQKGDKEAVWELLVSEVIRRPEEHTLCIWLMLLAYRAQLCTPERVEYLVVLTHRLETYCTEPGVLIAAYRYMTQVCSQCTDPTLRARAKIYYDKIPSLRDSREVYATCVLEGDALYAQDKLTLFRAGDTAAIALYRLIPHDANDEQRLSWLERKVELHHALLGDDFAGFYEGQLLIGLTEIFMLCVKLKKSTRAEQVLDRLLYMLDRHILAALDPDSVPVSDSIDTPYPKQFHPLETITLPLLDTLDNAQELQEYRARITPLAQRYRTVFHL